jgi:hypothetical protein
MVDTSENIHNVSTIHNVGTTYNNDTLQSFQHVLESLTEHGWQFVKCDSNIISMNKLFHELEEIVIEYKNNHYHFTLPLNKSIFSYYRKISDSCEALNYLEIYIDTLC